MKHAYRARLTYVLPTTRDHVGGNGEGGAN